MVTRRLSILIPLVLLTAGFMQAGAANERLPGPAPVLSRSDKPLGPAPLAFFAGSVSSFALGDFNLDGLTDVATAGVLEQTTILLGDGYGRLITHQSFESAESVAIAVGDFNADGRQDLAFAGTFQLEIAVTLGDGEGGFGLPVVATPVATPPVFIATGDFDGDGRDDLAVTSPMVSSIGLFSVNDDGSLSAGGVIESVATAYVIVEDLDGDGHEDIAAATGDGVSVFLGLGNGEFAPGAGFAAPRASSLAAADFDCDGIMDLITAGDGLALLRGDGAGRFVVVWDFFADTVERIAVGDFLEDGYPDFVTDRGEVFLNSRGRDFAKRVTFEIGSPSGSPRKFAAADFDLDGHLDVAQQDASRIAIHRGDGSGNFLEPARFAAGDRPVFVEAGDLNGDGITDLVTANSDSDDLTLLEGLGQGAFGLPVQIEVVGGSPGAVIIADFDRDHARDLAVANRRDGGGGAVAILRGDGAGGFVETGSYVVGDNPIFVATADLNHDRRVDLAVVNEGSDSVSILLGDGTGSFAVLPEVGVPESPRMLATADFDNDNRLDLAVASIVPDILSILLGDGSGGFTPGPELPPMIDVLSVVSGDFNHDGNQDLAVGDRGPTFPYQNRVSIQLGDGLGQFWEHSEVIVGGFNDLTTVDLDADGATDLAVFSSDSDTVTLLQGDGSGAFRRWAEYLLGARPGRGVAVDLDHNGLPDVVSANTDGDNVTVLMNRLRPPRGLRLPRSGSVKAGVSPIHSCGIEQRSNDPEPRQPSFGLAVRED